MIIDFHTHIFPDKIAEAVLANSEETLALPPRAPGTEKGLRDLEEEEAILGGNARRILFND